jgi:drug/metabolite transporter (DMT)-like permease
MKLFFNRIGVIFIGAAISCFLWGSAVPAIKTGFLLFSIDSSDLWSQVLFAGIRFCIAGVLTLLIGMVQTRTVLIPSKSSWKRIGILSVFQTILQYSLFYLGLAKASGVKSSIIVATNVFAAILIASLLFHQERLTLRKIGGCLLGFSGVILITVSGKSLDSNFHFLGEGLVLFSTISYAFSSVFMKRFSREDNPVMLSGWQFIIGGIVLTVAAWLGGGRITTVTPQALALLGYLAFISAAAYSIWGILLKYNPVSKVVVFGFLNPVFGVILSSLWLNESSHSGMNAILALLLVCAGIVTVSVKNE